MVQLTVNRSRISATRADCRGSGSKLIGLGDWSEGLVVSFGVATGEPWVEDPGVVITKSLRLGDIGDGSFQRCGYAFRNLAVPIGANHLP